ncbi:MAG: hypothetical protein ACT4O9_01235 [Blastocatellia bacterium]
MRQTLSILLLLLCTIPCFTQAALFDKYRFEDGGYTILGIFVHHTDHPLQKKIGEFYTDDLSLLNAIKKDWVFKKPQYMHACGYHYYIILLKNGMEIDSFSINLECNELVTTQGSVYFDQKKLKAFSTRFKNLKKETREFPTVADARRFLNDVSKTPDFAYAWPPRWLSHEGRFQFQVKCPADLGEDCWMSNTSDKLISRLRYEVTKKYPGEIFDLDASGGMTGGVAFVEVRSNKSLEEKFDLYDRWGNAHFGKWEPYHLSLTWYRHAP